MSLKDTWPGKAIFTDAFLRVLPSAPRQLVEPPPRRAPVARARRGANISYTPGPMRRTTRRGTWTHYMVNTILSHTSTAEAEAAHRASGLFQDKTLDFNWMFKINLITKVQNP